MNRLFIVFVCFWLVGCAALDGAKETVSGISDYFAGGEDNADPPAPLAEIQSETQIEVLWKESVGVGSDEKILRLVANANHDRIIAADARGLVQARDLKDGHKIWEVETDLPLSGGAGISANSVILGASNGNVIALNFENGQTLWKSRVPSEVLAIPVVAKNVVMIRTIDGSLIALDEKNGGKLWSYEHNVPTLSIRGTSTPLIIGDNIITGYDNGKLLALQLINGKFVWETSIVYPKGRSEVERLVDLDVDPITINDVIYIASYNGGTAAISTSDGDILWRNESTSSHSGLSHDYRYLYLTDSNSHIWQLDQRNGASFWQQKELHQRKLTAPAAYQSYVVAGDFEGYVHWFSSLDGRQLGRVQISNNAIDAKPIVIEDVVYVYTKDGMLAALKVK